MIKYPNFSSKLLVILIIKPLCTFRETFHGPVIVYKYFIFILVIIKNYRVRRCDRKEKDEQVVRLNLL